jgi:hypothetical protein
MRRTGSVKIGEHARGSGGTVVAVASISGSFLGAKIALSVGDRLPGRVVSP